MENLNKNNEESVVQQHETINTSATFENVNFTPEQKQFLEKYLSKLEIKYNKIVQDLDHEIYMKNELMAQQELNTCGCREKHDLETKANFKLWANEKREL